MLSTNATSFAALTVKEADDLRRGLARVKAEGEAREREIKQWRAADAERRLAEAQRQMEEYQKIALLLRSTGDAKGLRELVRQAMQLGRRVGEDLKLIGEGALSSAETDPEGALAALNLARQRSGIIAGQLQGLAALIDDDKDAKRETEAMAKSVEEAGKNLPFNEVSERMAQKTLERSVPESSPSAPPPEISALTLII